ncbi:MAG: hypothetical protein HN478_14350 [Rhodospirillaceae bacterium]|jgi:suppressor for copper-sensitivity B|nr:hypothetical protein [Rhodospirillaceae bacterium]MBT4490652.1 hypothetical protein [Rhodospirillaceae bacterium]MBT5191706.1 hypothetical protein [Rhodospirillaceae bacterium]MBT5897943.1 hypothetical protein [Rhodospirillaceae bacterium]MBT6430458.1 hypothetical protein [Rhodospirillaceae bacterium]
MTSIIKFSLMRRLAVAIVAFVSLSGAALAGGAVADWQGTDDAAVRLIAGHDSVDGSGSIWLGLQIRLSPGWKTYWRNPGESGAPPRFDWQASENLEKAVVRWPAPRRFSTYGYDSFGYLDGVVLPVLLQAVSPDKPVHARLSLDYMVCSNICVPMQAKLDLTLAPKQIPPSSPPGAFAALIRHYLERVPQSAGPSGLTIHGASVNGPAGAQILRIKAHADRPFQAPDLMVEGPEPFGFGRPKIAFGANGHDVSMDLPVYAGTRKVKLSDQALTLTLVDGDRSVERSLTLND